MYAKSLIALSTLAAALAQAQPTVAESRAQRVEIQATRDDAGKAIAATPIEEHGGYSLVWSQAAPSTLTRAEVVAEVLALRRQGLLNVMYGEDSGAYHLWQNPTPATRARAEVVAEVLKLNREGQLDPRYPELVGQTPDRPLPAAESAPATVAKLGR